MKILPRLFALLLLCAVAGGVWVRHEAVVFLRTAPEQAGREVFFDVAPGARFAAVCGQLREKNLITDAWKFRLLARWKKLDGRLQAGRFAMNTGWLPERTLNELVNGRPLLFRITIPEGLTWRQTGQALEKAGFVVFEDFRNVIADPDFLRHYGIPFDTAEGFLMPDTYLLKKPDLPDTARARAVAGRMVDNFWRKAAEVWPDGAKPAVEFLKKCVILASVVEKETGRDEERARVAGVFRNRLERGMPLQADPTVIYGLGEKFDGNLRRIHLEDPANAYNTYQHPGLPPGPICSFGMAALRAAVNPEAHDFLYFVAESDGGAHVFSANLSEHNKAVRRYLERRRSK
ncbi:MAG: endolytic transglycosylase MltG [Desulfovibrio sp.]|nr:endolytic transglycosylase MltG [Desulfovibrio sp.]